ncbi:hypothetical protein [Actinophytocola algeriensis]|uniref:Uncharacterized protein n=1 Tax=Actinophytocola algeriensis TaxID=1768010 RepID=A0A7W7Q827_9PSEU|nr:hypothetical protein [Actinophytocola algeriensis]MBB4908724.1 hypothetical protein [Actinophytocola algeriensis]MBE1474889.1 hypothetical protein [Actinophytocola algeriensis]
MVAYHSFGSQRAPVAMREAYLGPGPDDPVAAAAARTRSGWAIAEQLFPGRVYDHTCAVPLFERSHPESAEVWLGEFGDTVVCMVPSNVENQRVNRHVGADRPVRAELVEDERATLAYVDRVAGIERFVELGPEATRGTVRGSARGEPLPFEEPFLDGADGEVFPRSEYLREARSWLFAVGYPRGPVPPAATVVRGYLLGPVDGPPPLADGRTVVALPSPDELADLLAGAELLDECDGRYVAGGGDWFQLHRVDAEHALLVGCDVEDTETFFAAAVAYFGANYETDLLAAVPEWWSDLVRTRHSGAFSTGTGFDPINIVCGWDGRGWTKAIGAPGPVLLYHFLEPDEEA